MDLPHFLPRHSHCMEYLHIAGTETEIALERRNDWLIGGFGCFSTKPLR